MQYCCFEDEGKGLKAKEYGWLLEAGMARKWVFSGASRKETTLPTTWT